MICQRKVIHVHSRILAEQIREYPNKVVGDWNYFKVYPEYQINGLEFMVTTCTVSDESLDMSFPIFEDTCPSIAVQAQHLTDNPVTDVFGLQYRAFVFNSDSSGEKTELTLSCQVKVCVSGNCNPENC